MIQTITTHNQKETHQLAKKVLADLGNRNIITLEGELGAGKTTFSQGLLAAAGAEGPFTSPTFVIMKQYDLPEPVGRIRTIYHLDCYRVNSQDILDLGWQELISNPHNLLLVEWPEKIADILPEQSVKIRIKITGEEERDLEMAYFK